MPIEGDTTSGPPPGVTGRGAVGASVGDDGVVSADPEPTPPPGPPPRREPPPLVKPPRSALSMRDMVVALAVLVGMVLLLGGVTRSCSFAPGGPITDPAGAPVVDAPAALRELRVPLPLRIPAVPAGWRSNSVGQDRVEGGRVVRVGYLTSEGRYLRLLQSDAAEPAVLAREVGTNPVASRGTVDVDGQRWTVYSRGGQSEPLWTADVPTGDGGSVRMLITGSAPEPDFRTLAAAARTGELLPPRAP